MQRGPQSPVTIAYYSMEVALDDALPTYSGGLGVLAGDHLRAAADRGLPVGGVSLLYAHGFFRQSLVDGAQHERAVEWSPAAMLEPCDVRVTVAVCGRPVTVRPWRATVHGVGGHVVPVYFLDTDVEENPQEDRAITDRLYTNDPFDRLRQEAVLGLAGPLALEALGHHAVAVHHLNEGHGALVPVGLLARTLAAADPSGALAGGLGGASAAALAAVRERCVFTTHTPVPAGHDRFAPDVARAVLGDALVEGLGRLGVLEDDGTLNMTRVAMWAAGYVNAVSRRHRQVTRSMFPAYDVGAITNGVHTATWAAPATAALFDRRLPGWRADSGLLRYALDLPVAEVAAAHAANKRALCAEVRRRSGVTFRPQVLTIGVARRFAAYKRNDLVLADPERLAAVSEIGPVQIVFSGKAHPGDGEGKAMIQRVTAAAASAGGAVTVAFLEDYGMALGRLLCAGSDVWLNTPVPPMEASGTSGMKAALNGVPSLSTLDGWWLEGLVEGLTGWAIGQPAAAEEDAGRPEGGPGGPADAAVPGADTLYDCLEQTVVAAYYKDPSAFAVMGRAAMALNGSYFSAHRMVDEYARRAYRLEARWEPQVGR